jgi:hypothetical protein
MDNFFAAISLLEEDKKCLESQLTNVDIVMDDEDAANKDAILKEIKDIKTIIEKLKNCHD